MNISYSLMYWLTRLDKLNNVFEGILVLGGFALLILIIAYVISSTSKDIDDEAKTVNSFSKKWLKTLLFPWIFSLLGLTFVPTSKEMAMIYVVPNIAESQVIKQDIPEIYDLGVTALKDWLKKNKSE